jgi:hypothetical protein
MCQFTDVICPFVKHVTNYTNFHNVKIKGFSYEYRFKTNILFLYTKITRLHYNKNTPNQAHAPKFCPPPFLPLTHPTAVFVLYPRALLNICATLLKHCEWPAHTHVNTFKACI